ncbi:MAG: two-component system chemotaxis sensor kinase CheA, partial [Limisphaerales bacterium]
TAEFESPDAAANTDSPAPKAVPVEAPTSTGRSSKKSSGNSGIASVKVTTSKLDDLVNLVGEIVVAQSMVESDAQQTAEDSDRRSRNFSLMRRATRELQRVAMSMRMVPIQSCFMKMKRLVRDMAGRIGKEVELVMEGEDTELDRNIVEQIGDPLIHMVSNSLDHGIELPDRREETGKSRRGTIHLSARHQGGNIIIEIRDDGAGLDRERILQKAMENGIISDPSILTDREVYELVFAAGFSTAEAVTELSGRGVGMDVVRRNIESLHGKVEIDSQPGRSSVFSIHLPLTLAIIDGMLVTVGKQTFIIPTMTVRESMRITPDMVSDFRGRGELVDVRGQLIPLLRLYDRFGIEPRNTNPADGIVVVIESGQDVRCVLVDELIGKQEIVIKSLGDLFSSNRSLAGAAILGDGRVGLILDINTIVSPVETDFRIAA